MLLGRIFIDTRRQRNDLFERRYMQPQSPIYNFHQRKAKNIFGDARIFPIEQWNVDELKQKFHDFAMLIPTFRQYFGDNPESICINDLFGWWYTVRTLRPSFVVIVDDREGALTFFTRQTLPDTTIVCISLLEPRYGEKNDSNVISWIGEKYLNFGKISEEEWTAIGATPEVRRNSVILFNDHFDALQRIKEASTLDFKNLVFSNNYRIGCGSHRSLSHILDGGEKGDERFVKENELPIFRKYLEKTIKEIQVFINLLGDKVVTGEGEYKSLCLYKDIDDMENELQIEGDIESEVAEILMKSSPRHRWLTYIRTNF